MANLAKRFPGPFRLAVVASIASVGLAIGPHPDSYDPQTAVLTATLVAVIWYSFFSYCSLHPHPEAGRIQVDVQSTPPPGTLAVIVYNPTQSREVSFRWEIDGWHAGHPLIVEGAAANRAWLTLQPDERHSGTIPFAKQVHARPPQEAIMRVVVRWKDDLGDERTYGPEYWVLDALHDQVRHYIDKVSAEQRFALKGGT